MVTELGRMTGETQETWTGVELSEHEPRGQMHSYPEITSKQILCTGVKIVAVAHTLEHNCAQQGHKCLSESFV